MRHPFTSRSLILASLLAPAALVPAHAMAANADVSAGDWLVRGGLTYVSPKSDNKDLAVAGNVDVGSDTRPTGSITYMFTDNVGLELLAAIPFKHDIRTENLGKIGSVRHLPPTLSAQYHFNTASNARPYLGAGINYTYFFDEDTADVTGKDIDMDDSWGLALQAGVDLAIADDWFLNAEVRWIDIESTVRLDGDRLGTVEIDPWTFGMHIGYRF